MAEDYKDPDPYGIDSLINRLGNVLPGHSDENGILLPEYEPAEVRNQLGNIGLKGEILDMKRTPKDEVDRLKTGGVRRLLELYPNQKGLLKEIIDKDHRFENQRSMFDPQSSE